MNDIVKWIWLAQACGQGSGEVQGIIEHFGSAERVFEAEYDELVESGVSERLAEDLSDKRLGDACRIYDFCSREGVGIICYNDPVFPASLRALHNPPALLYYVGELPDLNSRLCISVVGTRRMSEYGMRAAYKIAYEVASSGAVVVSGMALGIDGIASCAAITARGKTIAVLGCGIDVVYPSEHRRLMEQIKQNGAIITEYPPSTEPHGYNFPVRNRLISGLSQGTVVIDADEGSGSMITAKCAILQGRDVYAVPGNIDARNTSGANSLIRDGAQAVLRGADIIKNYAHMYRGSVDVQKLTRSEGFSEFSSDAVRRMGVSMRTKDPFARKEEIKLGYKAGGAAASPAATASPVGEAEAERADIAPARAERSKDGIKKAERGYETEAEKCAERDRNDGDRSSAALESLNEKQRRIFDEMPLDRAVTVDYLTKTGFALGEVISALTVLEIKGLVMSLPGALYMRK